MSYDHFQPPEHFTRWQRFGYRTLALALFGVGMYLFALVALPILDAVVPPFADWLTTLLLGPKPAP